MSEKLPPLPAGETTEPARKKRGNGCMIAVIVGVVLGGLTLIFGGYYAMMHSSLPLSAFASTINKSGEASIEGLDGSLATGFKFDEFRIFKTGLGDSYIRDLSFKFNGMPTISRSARFIIDELHIGRIYLSLPTEPGQTIERETEFDPDFETQEGGELDRFELKSFRIDELVIQDAVGERNVGSVKLAGLVAEDDRLNLDQFNLTSDYVEARLEETNPTNRFRQAIRGTVRTTLHTNILKDLEFTITFGGETNGGAMRFELFGGEFVAAVERDGTGVVRFNEFSPSEWLGGFSNTVPTRMNFSVTGNQSRKRSKVSTGSLVLGNTTYEVPQQELDHVGFDGARLLAHAKVNEHKIAVRIAEPESGSDFTYEFDADTLAGDDLLAHALFAKPAPQLTDTERPLFEAFKQVSKLPPAPEAP